LLYVSVRDTDRVYTIVIDEQVPDGIDYVDCNGKREAEIAVSQFTAYYTVLGSVVINDLVGINSEKS